MEPLSHDPRSKQQIKDALYKFLYEPVQNQFKVRIDSLVLRNSMLGGFSHKSFVYKGILYNSESTHPRTLKNRLLPQLRPVMEDYLADMNQLNDAEVPYVLGFINQVLNASNDFDDYFRLLPESVHRPLQELIATCPCRNKHLSDERVAQIQTKNQEPINLMKQRLVQNLLI